MPLHLSFDSEELRGVCEEPEQAGRYPPAVVQSLRLVLANLRAAGTLEEALVASGLFQVSIRLDGSIPIHLAQQYALVVADNDSRHADSSPRDVTRVRIVSISKEAP